MKASITYEIITPESAEDGCAAEHGWWLPGGWEHALEDSEGRNESTLEQARAGEFNLSLRDAVKAAIEHGVSEGQVDSQWTTAVGKRQNGLSVRSVDPNRDYRTGEDRYYTLHISGLSAGSLARVRRYLKINGCRFY